MGTLTINNLACGSAVTTTTTQVVGLGYGALYNWYAATDGRNISSSNDWIVPANSDYTALRTYIANNGFNYDGTTTLGTDSSNKQGKAISLSTTWNNSIFEGEVGNKSSYETYRNITKFNIKGSGARDLYGQFFYLNRITILITTTTNSDRIYSMNVYNDNTRFGLVDSTFKAVGGSIRLIKTSTTLSHGQTGTYTGNDGKVYDTICIGTQEWLAVNLNETKFRNNDWITGFDDGIYTPISNSSWEVLTTEAMCYYNDDTSNG